MWVADKRAWRVRSKFLNGCAVPLDFEEFGGEVERWAEVRRCAEVMRSGKGYKGTIRSLVARVPVEPVPAGTSLPRAIRRIYGRMLARVPVLEGGKVERWIPPPATAEDLRWINIGCTYSR